MLAACRLGDVVLRISGARIANLRGGAHRRSSVDAPRRDHLVDGRSASLRVGRQLRRGRDHALELDEHLGICCALIASSSCIGGRTAAGEGLDRGPERLDALLEAFGARLEPPLSSSEVDKDLEMRIELVLGSSIGCQRVPGQVVVPRRHRVPCLNGELLARSAQLLGLGLEAPPDEDGVGDDPASLLQYRDLALIEQLDRIVGSRVARPPACEAPAKPVQDVRG